MPLPLNPRHGNAACTSPYSDKAHPALSGEQRLQEGSKRERRGRSEGWRAEARAGGKERLGDREGLELHTHSSWEGKTWCIIHAEDGNCSLCAALAGQSVGVAPQGGSQSCSPGRGHCCCYTQHQTPALLKRSPARAAAAKQAKDPSQASSTCLCCLSGVLCTLRCSQAGEQQDTGQAVTAISAEHCVPHGKESWEAGAVQSFQRVASQKESHQVYSFLRSSSRGHRKLPPNYSPSPQSPEVVSCKSPHISHGMERSEAPADWQHSRDHTQQKACGWKGSTGAPERVSERRQNPRGTGNWGLRAATGPSPRRGGGQGARGAPA